MSAKNNNRVRLIATSTFGLERIVKQEVQSLGFENISVSDGRIEFDARLNDIPKANIRLRCADRVLLKLVEFTADDFDKLFDGVGEIAWERFIPADGKITVNAKSSRSQLASARATQSITKKSVVERLKKKYKSEWLSEKGAEFVIGVSLLKDIALVTLDSSGAGLHKRGYRIGAGEAPLKETLAAGLVLLSFWKTGRLLIDPMCGSGTIPIEAAMIARNIAPGLNRKFAAENWEIIDKSVWDKERAGARACIKPSEERPGIFGYDIDGRSINRALKNTKAAGVGGDIIFEKKDINELRIDKPYGIVISNPPYGIRMGELKEVHKMYICLHKMFRKKTGWSLYIITPDKDFPKYFKRSKPDKVRKLYNGKIETNYYQYFGEKPPAAGGGGYDLKPVTGYRIGFSILKSGGRYERKG